MSKTRRKMSRKRSQRMFKKSAGASKFNVAPPLMRGGVRL